MPSPKPEGSGAALAKNWTVKVALGVLLSVPESVVVPPDEAAAVRVGAAWLLLAPPVSTMPPPVFE